MLTATFEKKLKREREEIMYSRDLNLSVVTAPGVMLIDVFASLLHL